MKTVDRCSITKPDTENAGFYYCVKQVSVLCGLYCFCTKIFLFIFSLLKLEYKKKIKTY